MALTKKKPFGVIAVVKKFRDEAYLKRFGDHLRSIRTSKGLSQEELAGRADTPLSQIGRIERGERAPTILTLLVIAQAMNLEPKALLDFNHKSSTKES